MIKYILNRILKKSRLAAIKNSKFGKDSKVESGSTFIDSTLGRHSFIGYDCNINNTEIGPFCSIASSVNIGGAAHPVEFLSTSPVFLSHRDSVKAKFANHHFKHIPRTFIGADVWVGQGTFIKSGVRIGHGAVVGMGSVVTKDVPDYAIVAGNPAKIIKYRFNKTIINELISVKWWELDDKKLSEIGPFITDPKSVIEKLI